MKFKDYLSENAIRPADFAQKIGRSTATIYRLRNESTKPDHDTMRLIVEATGGQVMPNDFFAGASES